MIWLRKCVDLICVACCCGLTLSACMHKAPAMYSGHTAVISGRGTAGYGEDDAIRKTLARAAAMTLDHGFRYFQITSPIKPGINVAIDVYREGEINPKKPGLWDAERIAQGDMGDIAKLHEDTTPIARPSATPAKSNSSTPNCTAYGCIW
jgi:hypothetical protein